MNYNLAAMNVINRISLQKALEICYVCVDYLMNKCLREKGLFRNPPSVIEIRKLRTHMLDERQLKLLKDSALDPHLVAGVLQMTLKDMPQSVFSMVYDEMMCLTTEATEFQRMKSDLVKCISNLDSERFKFVETLIAFLHILGTTPGNDANISQLVFIFAPLLCRPTNSAYMSVRHMEDLRKLRPTLQVIVENHAAIFKEARPAQQPRAEKSSSESQMMRLVYTESGTLLPSMESYSTEDDSIASTPVAYSPPSGDNSVVDFRKKKGSKLELHVSVSATADVNDASFSQLNQVSLRPVNFQSKEWNLLEQLVQAMSESFMRDPYMFFGLKGNLTTERTGENVTISANENDLMTCTIETFDTGSVGFGVHDSPGKDMGDTDDGKYWTNSGTYGSSESFSRGIRSPTSAGGSRSTTRRKMVYECRNLRQQITKFEKDFSATYNRMPKGNEKGSMQQIYSRYRDMKREIRTSAATDIQRLVRGHRCRKGLIKKFGSGVLNHPSLSPSKLTRQSEIEAGSPSRQGGDWSLASRGIAGMELVPPGGNTAALSADCKELCSKYKDLLLQKRTLKRRLKRFDEDFYAKHGRQPKKTDKEVMRPHYQKYHEVRNEMQSLKTKLERELGSLPLELQEETEGFQYNQPAGPRPNSEPSSDSGGAHARNSGGSTLEKSSSTPILATADRAGNNAGHHGSAGDDEDEELLSRYESHQTGPTSNSGDTSKSDGQEWVSATPVGQEGSRGQSLANNSPSTNVAHPSPPAWSRATSSSPAEIEALQKEKRQLHIMLKAYERDFNQIHGRHVMKPEDIAPVTAEYQRYKELKKRLKDL